MAAAIAVQSSDDDKGPPEDGKVVTEAKKLFARCEDWESHARQMYIEDQKFGHADSDNQWQWPDQLLTDRELLQKATLTINKTRVYCLLIINDAKQNKPGIVVHPTTNEATYEAAQVYEDVIRHIEYRSEAPQVYDQAMNHTVYGGWAYARVVSRYVSDDNFDQELLIRGVRDPLTVYLDPDAKEADKSDAEFGFVFDDMPRDKFDRLYPDYKSAPTTSSFGVYDAWETEDHVRVCEYWRKVHKTKTIVSVIDPSTGERVTWNKDDVQPSTLRQLKKTPGAEYREREADEVTVECYKIAGSQVVDRYDWPGKYIPIVPMVGEETVIDGQMDRKGHVRYLKDAQRAYNYQASGEIETGALQTKTPWSGPAKAFENFEEYWAQANLQNLPYLPWNHIDDDGHEIPAPQRVDPPRSSEAFMNGMKEAENQMMMASGQYQSQMGENDNAKSGVAINARQRQGDNATYHFIDAQATMVRQLGRILIDAIPHFYDTPRLLRIRGDDGMMKNIMIDPQAQQAVQKQEDAAKREVNIIFNPNVGEYSVESDVGPSYATRRQEAWNAIVQILASNKELVPIIGDLLFQYGDFPGADEIAQRLRRMAPKQALSDEPSQVDQQAQEQIQQLTAMVQGLNAKLADKSADMNIKAFEASVHAFNAMSDRLKVIGNAGPIVTAEQEQPLIASTLSSMEGQPTPPGAPQGAQTPPLVPQAPQRPATPQQGAMPPQMPPGMAGLPQQ